MNNIGAGSAVETEQVKKWFDIKSIAKKLSQNTRKNILKL